VIKKFFVIAILIVCGIFAGNEINKKISAQDIEEIAAGSKILVLNYHQVRNSFNSLAVSPSDFSTQMAYLINNGYIPITPDELESGLSGEIELPDKPVLITFDDGYDDNYLNAFPILKGYGIRATIFIVPAFVGKKNYLTWEQIKEMSDNGISIQSHTLNHTKLEELPDDEIRSELLNSKLVLEENTGKPVNFLAYPTGTYNLHIAGIAKDVGYKGAYTIKYGSVDLGSNMFALERVPIFQTENTMKDFYSRIEYRQSFEEFGWVKR